MSEMTKLVLDEKLAADVYDILVQLGGAQEHWRPTFIEYVTTTEHSEWRFMGHLGAGGKFYVPNFRVDMYRESETPERIAIRAQINERLAPLATSWWERMGLSGAYL